MNMQQKAKQLEAIDSQDPRYVLGKQAAAAGVALDMRMGHVYAMGWLEERYQQPISLKRSLTCWTNREARTERMLAEWEADAIKRKADRAARYAANPAAYAERRRLAGLPLGVPGPAAPEPSRAEIAEMHAARCISEITDYCIRFRGKRDALKEELNIAFQGARLGLKVIRWSAWA